MSRPVEALLIAAAMLVIMWLAARLFEKDLNDPREVYRLEQLSEPGQRHHRPAAQFSARMA